MEHALALFGSFDGNIKIVEDAFSVTIVARGTEVKISGDPENVYLASKTVEGLLTLIDKGEAITDQRVHYVIGLVRRDFRPALIPSQRRGLHHRQGKAPEG